MGYRPDLDTTLARYAEAWNTEDPDARWALVHACAAPEVTYLDPHSDKPVAGQAALASFMAFFKEQVGWVFSYLGPPDEHHDRFRIRWRLTDAGGTETDGLMVATLDREHRLVEITHFVDG